MTRPRLYVLPRLGQLFGGLLIGFALWRAETVVQNVRFSLANPQADHALAIEGAVLLAAFLSVGALLIFGLQKSIRSARARDERRARYADTPWLARTDWAEGVIRLNNRVYLIVAACLLFGYFGIVVPFCLFAIRNGDRLALLAFLALVGLFVFAVLRMLWTNRHWNRSELRLATLPGVVGGPFGGVVTIPVATPPDAKFVVRLECLQRSGKSETSIWHDETVLAKSLAAPRPDMTAVPVSLAVDYDCPPTEEGKRKWTLTVRPQELITTREAIFEVPVYRTAESRPDYELAADILAPYVDPTTGEDLLQQAVAERLAVVESRSGADGVERWTFQIRQWESAVFLGLVVVVAAALFIAALLVVPLGPLRAVAVVLTSVGALRALWSLYDNLFWQSTIEFGDGRVSVRSGRPGLRRVYATSATSGERRAAVSRPEDESADASGPPDSDARSTLYDRPRAAIRHEYGGRGEVETWSLSIAPPDGTKPLLLVPRIRGRQSAERLQTTVDDRIAATLAREHCPSPYLSGGPARRSPLEPPQAAP